MLCLVPCFDLFSCSKCWTKRVRQYVDRILIYEDLFASVAFCSQSS